MSTQTDTEMARWRTSRNVMAGMTVAVLLFLSAQAAMTVRGHDTWGELASTSVSFALFSGLFIHARSRIRALTSTPASERAV